MHGLTEILFAVLRRGGSATSARRCMVHAWYGEHDGCCMMPRGPVRMTSITDEHDRAPAAYQRPSGQGPKGLCHSIRCSLFGESSTSPWTSCLIVPLLSLIDCSIEHLVCVLTSSNEPPITEMQCGLPRCHDLSIPANTFVLSIAQAQIPRYRYCPESDT